jgi:hypothetical protein
MSPVLLALALNANAATLYVNGTPVDGLRNFEFTNVSVEVDENGDVFIIAPQYNVSLGDQAEAKNKKKRKNKDVTTPPAPSGDGEVPANRWWLISEDNDTSGHVVDVTVNGTVITTFKSGGKQLIMDVGPYLNMGENTLDFVSRGDKPGGGALFLYLGTGSVDAGRISQDEPKIKFKRNASSGAADGESMKLVVE